LEGATADATTWWPEGFDRKTAGVGDDVPLDPAVDLTECFTPGVQDLKKRRSLVA
jgi:hypothetical protein